MGPDLTGKRWIAAKGILFAFLALLAGVLQLLADLPFWQESVLLLICIWASCRFYYFLFHCLQAYVDQQLKLWQCHRTASHRQRSRSKRRLPDMPTEASAR